jgi:CelD/BcsL family acetyltransferase involved in cellulose biosynthesis
MATVVDAPTVSRSSRWANTPYRVGLVQTDDQLQQMANQWNTLAGEVPFRRWEWLSAWWQQFRQTEDTLYVLTARDSGGELRGIAPWFLRPTSADGRLLQFLGSGSACSEYSTILCQRGCERPVAQSLAAWLAKPPKGASWHTATLMCFDQDDVPMNMLAVELGSRRHKVHRWPGPVTWHVHLPASWDDFLATLSSRRRAHLRRLVRRYIDSGRAMLHSAVGHGERTRAFSHLCEFSHRRHSSDEETSTLASPRFCAFLRQVIESFSATDRLQLSYLELDGETVAVDYAMLGDETVYGYQMAMDPAAARHEPGWLLLVSVLRRAMQRGVRTFDFLRGSESYKAHWRAEPRPLWNMRIASRSLNGLARDRVWLGKECGKAWAKRNLQRLGLRDQSPIVTPRRVEA